MHEALQVRQCGTPEQIAEFAAAAAPAPDLTAEQLTDVLELMRSGLGPPPARKADCWRRCKQRD